jgi:hypothetical protein
MRERELDSLKSWIQQDVTDADKYGSSEKEPDNLWHPRLERRKLTGHVGIVNRQAKNLAITLKFRRRYLLLIAFSAAERSCASSVVS